MRINYGRSRQRSRGGVGGEREHFDGGAAGEMTAGLGEQNGGVAGITGEGGVEQQEVRAARGHGRRQSGGADLGPKADEFLVAGDVERVARVAGLRGAEAPEFAFAEEADDGIGAGLVIAAHAPGGDDPITAVGGGEERGIIFCADGIGRGFHFFRVRRAQAEKIGHPETIEAIAFGETGDAAQRGVELGFVGGARIQADPHDQTVAAEERIPPMDETVTVATVGGEMAGVFHRGQGGCGL